MVLRPPSWSFPSNFGISAKFLEDYMIHGLPDHMFVQSHKDQHKHKGWFYDNITKKFYRWDDLMALHASRKEST